MKTLLRHLLFLGLSAGFAFADAGPPIPFDKETHKITVPHTLLTLTDSQGEEIDALGTLTLSVDQWRELRVIGSACPKRIEEIVSVMHRDCGCGEDGHLRAIQLSATQVAIIHSELKEYNKPAALEAALGSDIILRMDRHGQFYHNGVLIPFPRLLELFSVSTGKTPGGYLGVCWPIGVTRDDPAVRPRYDKLFQTAQSTGRTPCYPSSDDLPTGWK